MFVRTEPPWYAVVRLLILASGSECEVHKTQPDPAPGSLGAEVPMSHEAGRWAWLAGIGMSGRAACGAFDGGHKAAATPRTDAGSRWTDACSAVEWAMKAVLEALERSFGTG